MPKIIGITTGIYEGNNYAKIFSIEPFPDGRGIGERAIIDRADYNYVMMNVLPKAAILIGSEVSLGYDRNGKVNNVQLLNPVE